MLVRSMSATTGSTVTDELICRSFVAAASALGRLLGHVGLVEEHLPLEVARLDEVAVDDADEADAGADQRVGQHGAQRPAAAERDARRPSSFCCPALPRPGKRIWRQ